jgi:hypothetical protein
MMIKDTTQAELNMYEAEKLKCASEHKSYWRDDPFSLFKNQWHCVKCNMRHYKDGNQK